MSWLRSRLTKERLLFSKGDWQQELGAFESHEQLTVLKQRVSVARYRRGVRQDGVGSTVFYPEEC